MTEKASNVIEALSRVLGDLPAIGKDQTAAAQQGGYAYRGIEQITQHVQPLLAKHGVVFAPHLHGYEVRDLTVNGKPWTDTYAQISYTVYGPGGIEDRIEVGPFLAIGRDNSDKGANKCATQAFKYALLQVLCISDAKDDGDAASHVADSRRDAPVERSKPLAGFLDADDQLTQHDDLAETVKAAGPDAKTHMATYRKTHSIPWPMSKAQLDECFEELARFNAAPADDTAPFETPHELEAKARRIASQKRQGDAA